MQEQAWAETQSLNPSIEKLFAKLRRGSSQPTEGIVSLEVQINKQLPTRWKPEIESVIKYLRRLWVHCKRHNFHVT